MGNYSALPEHCSDTVDDRATIYLDKDRTGFRTFGRQWDERLTCRNQGNPVFLLKGAYAVVIAHQEGGGGSRFTARFRTPEGAGPATTTDIHPASAEQEGIWTTRPLDFDTSVPGRHTITYYAEDSSGNLTTTTGLSGEDPPVLSLLLGMPMFPVWD